MEYEPDRRSILGWATSGLGAIFTAIIGVPIVCYAIDPRHRRGPKSNLKRVEGVKLDELTADPRQGVIRDVRVDGWTLYPNDVIGRVWVIKVGGLQPDLSTPEKLKVFNESAMAEKEKYLRVFTTICPHLGCSVNSEPNKGFACPCHGATFTLDGTRAGDANPALRGMDTLEWEIDDADRNRIKVKYQNFVTSIAAKKLVGS